MPDLQHVPQECKWRVQLGGKKLCGESANVKIAYKRMVATARVVWMSDLFQTTQSSSMIAAAITIFLHNGIANGNSIYYPDPRRLMTSSKLSQSTSLNNLNHNISRQDSDESNDHRTVRRI